MKSLLMQRVKEDEANIYLYGAGSMAKRIIQILTQLEVKIDGLFVDEDYVKDSNISGYEVFPIKDIGEKGEISIVMAMKHMERGFTLQKMRNVKNVYYPAYICASDDEEPREYIRENRQGYESIVDQLSDELSKELMLRYLKSIVDGDGECLIPFYNSKDSFFKTSFYEISGDIIYVDIGAFTGDTIIEYLRYVNNQYKRIYGFEANKDFFDILKDNIEKRALKDIYLYNSFVTNNKDVRIIPTQNVTGNDGYIVDEKSGTIVNTLGIDDVMQIKNEVVLLKINTSRDNIVEIFYSANRLISACKVWFVIKIGYIKQEEVMRIFKYFIERRYRVYIRLIGSRADDLTLFALCD